MGTNEFYDTQNASARISAYETRTKKKIIMKSNRYQHQVQGNLCALIKLVFMWKNGQVISLKRYELLVHFYATHALNPKSIRCNFQFVNNEKKNRSFFLA